MALGSLNLKVSKSDFEQRISVVEGRMAQLQDVVERYNNAKANLDQFIEGGDSNYEAMIERIDVNIAAAKKSYAALAETKASLQETVDLMAGMSSEVKETISSAAEATKSTVNAAIKVAELL